MRLEDYAIAHLRFLSSPIGFKIRVKIKNKVFRVSREVNMKNLVIT